MAFFLIMSKKLIISGDRVHDVGYRYFLMEAALNLGIERFRAENRVNKKQQVIAFVEGEEEQLNEYFEFVKYNFPEGAEVDDVRWEEYSGYIPRIEYFALFFNVMQTRKFIDIGRSIDGKMSASLGKQDKMLEKQDMMLEKQDKMLEKQDTMIEKQDMMLEKQDKMLEKQDMMLEKQDKMLEKQDTMIEKQDMMLEKQDMMVEKQDETIRVIKEEGRKTREAFKSHFDRDIAKIYEEINEIKTTLAKVIEKVGA